MIIIPITKSSGNSPEAIPEYLTTCDATAAAFAQNLPDATRCKGNRVTYKKVDSSTNAVTVTAQGAQKIDGAATYVLATQYKMVSVISDGTQWLILGAN